MAFKGYARLAFIDGNDVRHDPGDEVELPDETDREAADIQRLLNMGVVQRTNPTGNDEELDDMAPRADADGEPVEAPKRTRAQAKLAEKARREGEQ